MLLIDADVINRWDKNTHCIIFPRMVPKVVLQVNLIVEEGFERMPTILHFMRLLLFSHCVRIRESFTLLYVSYNLFIHVYTTIKVNNLNTSLLT